MARDLSNERLADLFLQARQGEQDALGRLFEEYRPYLLQIARDELDSDLRAKEGPSDLVQRSFMEATEAFERFGGTSPEVLKGWLKQILLNNVRDLRERFRTDKRKLDRERPALVGGLGFEVAGSGPSPSREAMRREQERALEAALLKLSEESRTLVQLRHRDACSFARIAQRFHITEEAARKRWARAIEELRDLLKGDSSSTS